MAGKFKRYLLNPLVLVVEHPGQDMDAADILAAGGGEERLGSQLRMVGLRRCLDVHPGDLLCRSCIEAVMGLLHQRSHALYVLDLCKIVEEQETKGWVVGCVLSLELF